MRYFLDLFAGVGGFALGAEWAGLRFDGHYFSEVDDYAIRVYSKRFPDAIALGDITKIDGTKLPAGDWIIAGGFPCQDISVAGKGAGLAGKRSGLWFEYARLIGELRPRFAIMENVGALTFRGMDEVLGSLSEIGYDAEWQDIRASDVGAPHKRERIWIVAYPRLPESSGRNETEERQQSIRRRAARSQPASCNNVANPDSEHGQRRPEPQQSTSAGGKPWNQPSWSRAAGGKDWWATEPAFYCLVDGLPAGMDRYEGRTCAGMPDRASQLKCLGNAIVPQIAMLIFQQIKREERDAVNPVHEAVYQ